MQAGNLGPPALAGAQIVLDGADRPGNLGRLGFHADRPILIAIDLINMPARGLEGLQIVNNTSLISPSGQHA